MAGKVPVRIIVNKTPYDVLVEPRQTLLEVLREEIQLIGSKEGCGNGNCGACSVIIDGRVANSCLILAVQMDGKEILTIEGLAAPGELHPLQRAFLEEAALQCGICTPGFIMAAKSLLDANPDPSEEQVRHHLAGNLCRCTGYDKIVRAVLKAAAELRGSDSARVETGATTAGGGTVKEEVSA